VSESQRAERVLSALWIFPNGHLRVRRSAITSYVMLSVLLHAQITLATLNSFKFEKSSGIFETKFASVGTLC
jgi:hypothetical protein